jgi:hypothetical protein
MKAAIHPVDQPADRLERDEQIGDPLSPYLLTEEAARFLRFNTPHLFHKWAVRHRVPVLRRGRTLLYEKRVLVAFMEGRPWTTRRLTVASANRLERQRG